MVYIKNRQADTTNFHLFFSFIFSPIQYIFVFHFFFIHTHNYNCLQMAQMARPCIFAHIEDNLVQVIDLEPSMEDDIGVLRTYVHQQMNWTHSILVIIDLFEYEHNLGFYSPRIVRCFMQPEHVMEFYTEAKEYGVRFVETAGLEPLQREVPPKLPPRRKESLRKSSDSLDSLNTVFEADLISL